MPAAGDVQALFADELRPRPLEDASALGKRGDRIQLRQRGGRGLHRAEAIDELRQKFFVDLFLACERALARTQHLVLERLQFGRDESLGRLHSLAPDVVLRNSLGIFACDLDEESLHAVESEFQSRDPRALAFALLERQEKFVSVRGDAAQLVEVRVIALGDHVTVAQKGRRIGCNARGQQIDDIVMRVDAVAQPQQQWRVDVGQGSAQ